MSAATHSYVVTWQTEVLATSPQQAADYALQIMTAPEHTSSSVAVQRRLSRGTLGERQERIAQLPDGSDE